MEDNGMVVCSSHGPWASPDNLAEVIENVNSYKITLPFAEGDVVLEWIQ